MTTGAASRIGAKTATSQRHGEPERCFRRPTGSSTEQHRATACRPVPTAPARARVAVRSPSGISGLVAGTTYHFRLVAQSSAWHDRRSRPDVHDERRVCSAGDDGYCGRNRRQDRDPERDCQPERCGTNYWFQYGTTTSYGLQTGTHSAGSSTSDKHVSAGLSGLVAGTTYHFRLVAQNSGGTTNGQDQMFTTSAANAPKVTTAAASGIGAKTATVNGTVNPNGASTTYWFQYGTTTGYGLQTGSHGAGGGTSDQHVSANLSGLVAGTTYHLPPRRSELRRHHQRARSDVHDLRRERAAGDDRRGEQGRREDRHPERDRQPERCGYHLLVPVRNDDGLRPADGHPRRRLGHEQSPGLGGDLRPCRRHHLPLPPGRPELRRRDQRRRPDVHDKLSDRAGGDDRRRRRRSGGARPRSTDT